MMLKTPRLLDRLARLRRELEQARAERSHRRRRLAATLLAALVITGGLARLAFDDEVAPTAMPEPQPSVEQRAGTGDGLDQRLAAGLLANAAGGRSDDQLAPARATPDEGHRR